MVMLFRALNTLSLPCNLPKLQCCNRFDMVEQDFHGFFTQCLTNLSNSLTLVKDDPNRGLLGIWDFLGVYTLIWVLHDCHGIGALAIHFGDPGTLFNLPIGRVFFRPRKISIWEDTNLYLWSVILHHLVLERRIRKIYNQKTFDLQEITTEPPLWSSVANLWSSTTSADFGASPGRLVSKYFGEVFKIFWSSEVDLLLASLVLLFITMILITSVENQGFEKSYCWTDFVGGENLYLLYREIYSSFWSNCGPHLLSWPKYFRSFVCFFMNTSQMWDQFLSYSKYMVQFEFQPSISWVLQVVVLPRPELI